MRLKLAHSLILALLVVISSALYEHQAGNIDWKVKTFGELENVKILNDQLVFLNSQNQFGSIQSSNGEVIDSEKVDNKVVLWNKNQKSNILISDQSSLLLNNLRSQVFQSYPEVKLNGEAVDFLEQDGNINLITETQLIYASSSKTEELLKAQKNERFLRVEKDSSGNLYLISISEQKLCILSSVEDTKNAPKRNCHNIQNSNSFDSQKLVVTPKFIFYGEEKHQVLFHLQAQQWQDESFSAKTFWAQDDLILAEQAPGQVLILEFKGKKLEKLGGISHPSEILFLSHQESDAIYFASQKDHTIEIYQFAYKTSKQPEKLASYYSESLSPLKKGWLRKINSDTVVLLQKKNLQTEFYSHQAKKLLWRSQQSIADALSIAFVDYPKVQTQSSSYFETIKNHGAHNPIYLIPAIQRRLTEEFFDLVHFITSSFSRVVELAFKLVKVREMSEVSELNRGLTSQDDDILYGMRKQILVITKQKVLVSYDSKQGQIEWEQESLSNLLDETFHFEGLYKLGAEQRLVLVYHSEKSSETHIYEVSNQNQGQVKLLQKFSNFGKSLTVIEIDRDNHNYLVFVNDRFEHKVFPAESEKQFEQQTLFFYRIDSAKNRITGFSNQLNPKKFDEIWNFHLSQNETIVAVDSPFKHSLSSAAAKIAIFDDVKIIYKHIDYLNLAIATQRTGKSGTSFLNLYVLNTKTGRVLFNSYQLHVEFNLPINLIYDENSVVVTYFNQIQSIYEAWVVEVFSNKIETSFMSMLEKYYFTNTLYSYYDYVDQDLNIVFLEQKYGLSLGVKSLDVVQSKLSLTKRNLVAITQQNQIYQIDRIALSTRRAIKDKTDIKLDKKKLAFESVELPPYNYLLQVNPLNSLSYYIDLEGINKIQFVNTELESTQIIVVYGGDLFVSKIAPDRSYDMLTEGFNYIQLVGTVILMIAVVYVMRSFYLQSKVFKIFHR